MCDCGFDVSVLSDLEIRDILRSRLVRIRSDSEVAQVLVAELKCRGLL